MKNESVLILGAAALQVPLINFVRGKGYRVIVVSIAGDYPGFNIADKCIIRDVRDFYGIVAELSCENVVAVLTDQTDIAVPTVARIAEYFGLSGNDVECAETYSNKRLIRETCQKLGIPSASFFSASTVYELHDKLVDFTFPVIIKPEDNQGSRGVRKAFSKDELETFFDDAVGYSSTNSVIVEEFFEGEEYVVEGFCYDGEYLNFGIAERRYFDLENKFIPSQTIFPAVLPEDVSNRLLEAEKRLHKYLKPKYGMIHSEWLFNRNTGRLCLVETALRGGGVYISSDLVPLYSGVENYSLLLDAALNKSIDINLACAGVKPRASAYLCFYLPEGIIESIDGLEELTSCNFVKRIDIQAWIVVGAKTKTINDKTQRLGPIIIEGENREDIEKRIEQVQHILLISVRKIDGSQGGIIWD